ncbi:MAG: DnaJ domain-containing protein, partial [Desulfobacterales bacterium]|nr:DnaJ domain-containing protein [Desulfobacterales bacterium]
MDLKHAFQLLDLDAGASAEAFKKRYHDLAAAWHPDRHAQDDRSQALASERMKAINSAYEAVCAFLNGRMAVTCAACGAAYRKPADVNLDYAACSACGKQLRKPLPRKKRTPCGNDRCAGTLGSSGRCTYCGKTIAE